MQLTNAQQVGSEIGTNPTQLTLPELFRKVEGSVVQVSTSIDGDDANGKSGLGSGFIYDRDGHIITNPPCGGIGRSCMQTDSYQ